MRNVAVALAIAVAVLLPCTTRAHPCEEEVAKAGQWLDVEARNLVILEMQGAIPQARAMRFDYDRRFLLFISMRDQCAAQVRAEQTGAPAAGGCSKDVDCKGDRICVSGMCVYP